MIWRRFLENQTCASIANKGRCNLVVRAGTTGAVEGDYLIKIRLGRIAGSEVIVGSAGLRSRYGRQKSLGAGGCPSQDLVIVDHQIAGISFRPGQVNSAVDSAHIERWHARRRRRNGRIKACNEPSPTRLARDYAPGGIAVAGKARRARSRLLTGAIRTAIDVRDFNPPLFVDSRPDKVEQVATDIGTAVCPKAAALHCGVRSGVGGRPVRTSVEGRGNVEMPNAGEPVRRLVATCGRTEESNRCAVRIGCRHVWVADVL